MSARFAFGVVIRFSDGGEPEEQVLGFGTREQCDGWRLQLPAVSYGGDRPNPQAASFVVEVSPEVESAWREAATTKASGK